MTIDVQTFDLVKILKLSFESLLRLLIWVDERLLFVLFFKLFGVLTKVCNFFVRLFILDKPGLRSV